MKYILVIIFFCAGFCSILSAQTVKYDTALIHKIDTMFKYDQFWRIESRKAIKGEKSKYDQETIERKWAITDSLNEVMAKEIISKYGYPGYNLVGEISDNFGQLCSIVMMISPSKSMFWCL